MDGGKQANEDVEFGRDKWQPLQYNNSLRLFFISLITSSIFVDVNNVGDAMV